MLPPDRYRIVPVGITRDGRWHCPDDIQAALDRGIEAVSGRRARLDITPGQPAVVLSDGEHVPIDFAFPIMHGTYAEDGTIQGLLELTGVAYAGAGVAASAVGMDKELMKDIFAAHGLPQTEYLVLRDNSLDAAHAISAAEATLDYPMFVKPANLGSSVGMTKAHSRPELVAGIALAAQYDRKVIVERAVAGRELECAVLGNESPRASVAGEVLPANEYYDFEAKYTDGMMQFIVPADIGTTRQKEIGDLATAAFAAVDCSGYARCDFFLEDSGRVLINEINTIPGMTRTSGFPRLWAASGVGSEALIESIVELGLQRHAVRHRLQTT